MTSGKIASRSTIAATVAVFMAGSAFAQDGGSNFSLGFGVYSQDRAYGDTTTSPVPLINYDSTYFRLRGSAADLKLPWVSTDAMRLSFRARYSIGEGYEASDADILTGMEERNGGFWTGAALEWDTDFADLSVEGLVDASGDSDGYRIRLEASRTFRWDRISLTPRIVGNWMDDSAIDYYYGVRPDEATFARPAYEGSSTMNIEFGLRATYAPAQNHLIIFDASVTRVGGGIKDSPITTEDTLTSVGLGYMYRF